MARLIKDNQIKKADERLREQAEELIRIAKRHSEAWFVQSGYDDTYDWYTLRQKFEKYLGEQ